LNLPLGRAHQQDSAREQSFMEEHVMRKLVLIFVTATACGALPQIAAASCSGSACSAFYVSGKTFTNKDKDLKVHLTGCVLKADGSCPGGSANFDITIDAGSSKPIPVPSSSTGDVKVDVKTAAFVGALTQPHVQSLPSTNSIMTTINNQTDTAVTVKYRDVEGSEYSKEIREHSNSSVAIRMAPDWKSNPVKWSAYVASKMCDSGAVAGSSSGVINVTQCKKTCELSMDKKSCELERDMKQNEQTGTQRGTGGPQRTQTVLDTKPIPAKKDDSAKVPEVHGCTPSGSPDAPADVQGNKSGVMDGHSGGCSFKTNLGGGRK
jgi:hypothetical protein